MMMNLKEQLAIKPRDFGKDMHSIILERLREQVEGNYKADMGYVIICVTKVEDVGKGLIDVDDGSAVFTVKYEAIAFKLFKNEVVSAKIVRVGYEGFWAHYGCAEIFVSRINIPEDWKYNEDVEGQVGFRCTDEEADYRPLKAGDFTRIRIERVSHHNVELKAMGSIKDMDYLL